MEITKVYQLIHMSAMSKNYMVDGVKHRIDFIGAITSPGVINGKFTTNKPGLIEALERDPLFNKEYVVLRVFIDGKEVNPFDGLTTPEEKTKVPPQGPPVVDDPDIPDAKDDLSTITTVYGARIYLLGKFPGEAKSYQLKNKESILKFADLHGVKFPNVTLP